MEEKKDIEKPGLHLATKVVKMISGPVSMVYMKPNMTPPDKMDAEHPYHTFIRDPSSLPLILLWGDIHRDDKGMCPRCDCTSDKQCCYTIYDKDYLKELDLLAANYPIDFYTESSGDYPRGRNTNILFERFFHRTVKACHDRPLRSKKSYETECPTKNIRWHYADTRFFDNILTIEPYLFRAFMENVTRHAPTSDSTMNSPEEKRKFIISIGKIHEAFFDNIYEDTEVYKLQAEAQKLLLKMYLILLQSTDPSHAIEEIFTVYIECITKKPVSVIYKQIKKTNAISISNKDLAQLLTKCFLLQHSEFITYAVDQFHNHLDDVVRHFLTNVITDPELVEHPEMRDSPNEMYYTPTQNRKPIFKGMTSDQMRMINKVFRLVSDTFLWIGAVFVDIYAIFRMFKSPKDNSTPYLSMGYFGDGHVINMSLILKELGYKYPIVYRTKENDMFRPRRCINIGVPILLKQDLEERARVIRSNPHYDNTFHKYHQVLKGEKWNRNTEQFRNIGNVFEGGRKKTQKGRKGRKGRKGQKVAKTKRRRTHRRRSA